MKTFLVLLSIATSFPTFGKILPTTKQEQLEYQSTVLSAIKRSTFKCNQTKGDDLGLRGTQLNSFFEQQARAILLEEIKLFIFSDPSEGQGYMQFSALSENSFSNSSGQRVNVQDYASVRVVLDSSFSLIKYVIFFNTNKYNQTTGEDSSVITLSADCNVM